jgi:pilus assembly protein CpaF
MLSRLETMVLSGSAIPLEAIRQQISSAIDIMVHLSRFRDRTRKVVEIVEVMDCSEGIIGLNPLYVFEENRSSTSERVDGCLMRTCNSMQNLSKFSMAGLNKVI